MNILVELLWIVKLKQLLPVSWSKTGYEPTNNFTFTLDSVYNHRMLTSLYYQLKTSSQINGPYSQPICCLLNTTNT